jgi:hypothetical protein
LVEDASSAEEFAVCRGEVPFELGDCAPVGSAFLVE